jgi:hypothetical protein
MNRDGPRRNQADKRWFENIDNLQQFPMIRHPDLHSWTQLFHQITIQAKSDPAIANSGWPGLSIRKLGFDAFSFHGPVLERLQDMLRPIRGYRKTKQCGRMKVVPG